MNKYGRVGLTQHCLHQTSLHRAWTLNTRTLPSPTIFCNKHFLIRQSLWLLILIWKKGFERNIWSSCKFCQYFVSRLIVSFLPGLAHLSWKCSNHTIFSFYFYFLMNLCFILNWFNMSYFFFYYIFLGISILVRKRLWTSLIDILSTLCIFAWRLLKCKKLIVANKQVTKLFYFSWMTSSTSLCRAPTIGQPKDLLETHLDHCWGPHWWFDALKSVTVLHFGRFRHAWKLPFWGKLVI